MPTCVASEQFDVVADELTLQPKQAARVRRTTAQSISHGSLTRVNFEAERFDNDSMWTPAADTRITFNTAGLYMCIFHGRLASAGDYDVAWAEFLFNDDITTGRILGPPARTTGAVAGTAQLMCRVVHRLEVGDFMEVRVFHRNGAAAARNLEVADPASPELAVARIDYGL